MAEYSTMQERLSRIAGKLAAIGGLRQRPAIFGAQEHHFQLGPPLAEHDVEGFERRHGIILPADYRAFLTRVGNGGPGRYGGAGPYYGLLPLDRWDDALVEPERPGVLGAAFPVVPGAKFGTDWLNDACLLADGEEWFPGAIALSHVGCGDMAVLVVTGPGRGRVAYTQWAAQAPSYPPDLDFLAWYERWLDAATTGHDWWC